MKKINESYIELEERELPYLIKTFADKTGKSEATVKDLFQKAKLRTKDQLGYSSVDNFDEKAWKYTVGILKKMLGITESYKGDKNIIMKRVVEKSKKETMKRKSIILTKPVLIEGKLIPAGYEIIVEKIKEEDDKTKTAKCPDCGGEYLVNTGYCISCKKKVKESQIKENYNGWTNRETWNVNLWVNNDEDIYDMVNGYKVGHKWTPDAVKDAVMDIWPNGTPDMKNMSDYKKVNWKELANGWN